MTKTQPLLPPLVRIAVALAIAFATLVGKDWSLEARQAIFGQRQIQFYVPYSGSTPVLLPPVLLVAHNAGNQPGTAARARAHDAAGLEIDVRYVDGRLYATHSAPASFMPKLAWRAPRLGEAWAYASGATVLKLDLKSTGRGALDALVRFLHARPTEQQIFTVSTNPEALAYLDLQLPDSIQVLSLSNGNDLDKLLAQDGRVDGVEGVSLPHWVLTPARIAELKERGYVIDAWTVNDVERLVELSSMGVDAITTDNLAFFDMAVAEASESELAGD